MLKSSGMDYERIALLESRLANLTRDINFTHEYQSHNVDVFFLLAMAMIIFCKYLMFFDKINIISFLQIQSCKLDLHFWKPDQLEAKM